jgi:hypothetical protein
MTDVIQEALRQLAREGPAIPFRELVDRLRARGTAVTESVLARALEAPDSGARLVDPWGGHHAHLRELLPEEVRGSGLWVILPGGEGNDPDPDPPAGAALDRSILRLGRALDARSPGDLARWMALLQEARRLPRAA